MKLTSSILFPILYAQTPTNCDLSKSGIFEPVGYGTNKFVFNIDYKVKTSGRLQNKGKVRQAYAELMHQHTDVSQNDFSDAFLVCVEGQADKTYVIKCYNNGSFDINGKTGSDIELPNCGGEDSAPPSAPIVAQPAAKPSKGGKKPKPVYGCHPIKLGPYGKMIYTTDQGCTKGYVAGLENKFNSCVRQCNTDNGVAKTAYPITCYCKKGSPCYYRIKVKGVGHIPWDSVDSDGNRYIPVDICESGKKKEKVPVVASKPSVAMDQVGSFDAVCSPDKPLTLKERQTGIPSSAVIWNCNDGENNGSVCQKSCAPGYFMKGNKKVVHCGCATERNCNNGPAWRGRTASCIKKIVRSDEQVRNDIQRFTNDIFDM